MIYLEKMTLGALCRAAAAKYGKRLAFNIYREGGSYDRLSYGDLGDRARRFALLLTALGIKAGDRVMILSENRPEWAVAYFGAALAGAVSVPALIDFVPGQIKTIAEHAGVSLFCVSVRTAGKIAGASGLPLIYIDSIEDEGPGKTSVKVSVKGLEKRLPLDGGAGGDASVSPGDISPEQGAAPDTGGPFPEVREEDCASIVYTSGTTGNGKGVMLSHRNLIFTAAASRSLMKIYPRDRLLSVIPLAHTYECTLGLLTPVMNGASITYLDKPPSPAILLPAIQTLRPTAMVTVPLFIEKIYRNYIAPSLEANPLYRFPPTRFLAVRGAGHKLLAAFGGAIRFFGIGGAPLAEDVERFLRKVEFPYAPGYGLTETAPLAAGTAPYKFPFRSAGSALKGVEIRIAEGGEIQIRGPNVMMGYYRDEERTREAFTADGWFKTGDLGFRDKKGCLFIRGRIKALILGPSGENIYPEEIENLLHVSALVEEALVYPGEKGELIALVVLSEKTRTMLAAIGDSLEELKNMVNKQLAAFSRIKRIEVRKEPFEKTATAKIKRFLYPLGKEQAVPGAGEKSREEPAGNAKKDPVIDPITDPGPEVPAEALPFPGKFPG